MLSGTPHTAPVSPLVALLITDTRSLTPLSVFQVGDLRIEGDRCMENKGKGVGIDVGEGGGYLQPRKKKEWKKGKMNEERN